MGLGKLSISSLLPNVVCCCGDFFVLASKSCSNDSSLQSRVHVKKLNHNSNVYWKMQFKEFIFSFNH